LKGPVKVGTRGSPLALAQTQQVVRRLQELHPSLRFVVVPIKTTGDRLESAAALRMGGKGLFVKEIERALLKRQISMAVHSMKDLPSELPEGLAIGAVPERADASDVFIGRNGEPIEKLAPGSVVGTASLRRQAILSSLFPRLRFADLKGNLDTRLEKLKSSRNGLAGIVVAMAGLLRLHPENGVPVQPLPRATVVPAAGQGALCLEIREADDAMRKVLAPIHHPETAACVEAERELQRRLEGGCQVPLGAHAELSGDGILTLTACIASVDGRRLVRESQSGTTDDPRSIAAALETVLVSRGAREILDALRPKPAVRKPAKKKKSSARKPARKAAPRRRPKAKSKSRR
jgi:hydroxymethylbilane synthase